MSQAGSLKLSRPKDLDAAALFVGVQVQKAFASQDGGKPCLFSGVVKKVLLAKEKGSSVEEICFRVRYEDGDTEDIGWNELKSIMQPVQQHGPTDKTNKPSDRLPFPALSKPTKGDGAMQDAAQGAKRRVEPSRTAADEAGAADDEEIRRAKQKKRRSQAIVDDSPENSPPALEPSPTEQGKPSAQRIVDPGARKHATQPPQQHLRARQPSQQRQQSQDGGAMDGMDVDEEAAAASRQAEAGPSGRGRKRRSGPDVDDGNQQPNEHQQPAAAVDEEERRPPSDERQRRKGSAATAGDGDGAGPSAGPSMQQQQQRGAEEQVYMPLFADDMTSQFKARVKGSAGHIAKIHVENFMCHGHFEIVLGTHVTLISGTNGSGKSAVMQALQACLGASARQTGRASTLHQFIKTGAHDAKVQVTLWNTGPDAYMPETYGEQITVERRITKTTCPFKLICARGKAVSAKKEDVDAMMDYFAIDASNPLTIITQDMARQFLAVGKDDQRRKYDMFMTGTLLTEIQAQLALSNQRVFSAAQKLNDYGVGVQKLNEEVKELTAKLDKLRGCEQDIVHRELWERSIAWQTVLDFEQDIQEAKDWAEKHAPETLQMAQQQLERLGKAQQDVVRMEAEAVAEMQRHLERQENFIKTLEQLRADEKMFKSKKTRAERQLATLKQNIQNSQVDQQHFEQQLSQDNRPQAQEQKRKYEELTQLATAKQEAMRQALERANSALQALNACKDELGAAAEAQRRATWVADSSHMDAERRREEVRQLEESQRDRTAMFGGPAVVQLKQAIQQQRRMFSQEPIGPIGAYLKVKDAKWAQAVEAQLGSVFNNFIVSTGSDATALRRLAAQVGMKSNFGVTVLRFDLPRHNIPPSRTPQNGYGSVLDQLIVEDARAETVLLNYFVDRFHVECTALALTATAGRDVIYHQAAGPCVNVAYGLNGDSYNARPGGVRYCQQNRSRGPIRLVGDASDMLCQAREMLEQQQVLRDAHRQELQEACAKVVEVQERAAELEAQYKAAAGAKGRANTELMRATQALNASQPSLQDDEDEDMQVAMTQLQDVTSKLMEMEANLANYEDQLRAAEEDYQRAQSACITFQSNQHNEGAGDELRERVAQLAEAKNSILDNIQMVRSVQEQLDLRIRRAIEELAPAEPMLQQAREQANKVCSRREGLEALQRVREIHRGKLDKQLQEHVRKGKCEPLDEQAFNRAVEDVLRTKMPLEELRKDHERICTRIALALKDAGCNRDELEIRLQGQAKLAQVRTAMHKSVSNKVKLLREAYDKRVRMYGELREKTEQITNAKFRKYLGRRNHLGRIALNHEEQTLALQIKPNGKINPSAAQVDDLKQLSGGEKSYTTVAFLLAIGHSTESPFRCMDEFDVFMDAINRRVATETLLEFALENAGYQYIFLTPQDLQAVEDARQQVEKRRKVALPQEFLKTVRMIPARANATQA